MHMPIKACGACLTDYDREEWAALPLLRTTGTVELRKCEGSHPTDGPCSSELSVDVAGFERMRAFAPWEEYAEMWPDSDRLRNRLVQTRPPSWWARIKAAWSVLWS